MKYKSLHQITNQRKRKKESSCRIRMARVGCCFMIELPLPMFMLFVAIVLVAVFVLRQQQQQHGTTQSGISVANKRTWIGWKERERESIIEMLEWKKFSFCCRCSIRPPTGLSLIKGATTAAAAAMVVAACSTLRLAMNNNTIGNN